jgi:hypothetical protein
MVLMSNDPGAAKLTQPYSRIPTPRLGRQAMPYLTTRYVKWVTPGASTTWAISRSLGSVPR